MPIPSNVQTEPLTHTPASSLSASVLNVQKDTIVNLKVWIKRLMCARLVITAQRELGTDFHILAQWDFTENCLLQCQFRIAVFASLVTTAMNWAWQIQKHVQRASSVPLALPFLSHVPVVTMVTHQE